MLTVRDLRGAGAGSGRPNGGRKRLVYLLRRSDTEWSGASRRGRAAHASSFIMLFPLAAGMARANRGPSGAWKGGGDQMGDELTDLLASTLAPLGMELVDMELRSGTVRVVVDRSEGAD